MTTEDVLRWSVDLAVMSSQVWGTQRCGYWRGVKTVGTLCYRALDLVSNQSSFFENLTFHFWAQPQSCWDAWSCMIIWLRLFWCSNEVHNCPTGLSRPMWFSVMVLWCRCLPAGCVVLLLVAERWCSQSEVDEATECAVSGVAVVQSRHKGWRKRYEERLKIQVQIRWRLIYRLMIYGCGANKTYVLS